MITLQQLREVLNLVDLSNGTILEQIKGGLERKDEDTYQKWKKEDFDLNHLFDVSVAGDERIAKKSGLLHFAAKEGYVSVVEALIKAGADVDKEDKEGNTPLILAVSYNNIYVIEALIKAGADVNKNEDSLIRRTSLVIAAREGYTNVVEVLIKAGADVGKGDQGGRTPLFYASRRGYKGVAEALIKAGADVNKNEDSLISKISKEALKIFERYDNELRNMYRDMRKFNEYRDITYLMPDHRLHDKYCDMFDNERRGMYSNMFNNRFHGMSNNERMCRIMFDNEYQDIFGSKLVTGDCFIDLQRSAICEDLLESSKLSSRVLSRFEDFEKFAPELVLEKYVEGESLRLDNLKLTQRDVRLLSNFLSPSPSSRRSMLLQIPSYPTFRITHISLRNTEMGNMSLSYLAKMQIDPIVTLDLADNDIDAKGAKALAESKKAVQGIQSRFYELLSATWLANSDASRLSTDTTKELFLRLAQHGVTSSEIGLLLDDRNKYPLLIDLLKIRDLLERKILERFYERNIGNIQNFGVNFYVFQKIIEKLDTKTLGNFMKAILGDVCVEKLNLDDNRTLLQNYTVERIKVNTVIEDSESIALDFLDLKEFLESNTAPHETKYEEKRKNKKLSEEFLSDIYRLYEKDSDTQPTLEKVSLVASECSEQVNNAQGKSKLPVIVPPALAIAGIVSGIAIAVYLEMLAVGIAVGACCLVAVAIVYCYSRPSSSLENSNVQEKIARDVT